MSPRPANARRFTAAMAARYAVFAIFFLHGFILGSWVVHLPLAKERLGVSVGTFGWALLACAAGAVVAMPLAGGLVHRFGSRRVTSFAGGLFCLSVAWPATAATLPSFVAGLAVFGAAIGSMDVAMNAHGLAVEKELRRAVMSSYHGGFSLGAMAGTLVSAFLIGTMGARMQLVVVCGVCLAALAIAVRRLLDHDIDRGLGGAHFAWPTVATVGLGSLCFLVLLAEGAVLDWSAIHLREKFELPLATAGLGYALFSCAMAAARFAGDRFRNLFGATALVRWSGIVTAIGMATATLSHDPLLATSGYAIAGLGIGNIAPVLFAGGGRVDPNAPGRGVAAVVTMGYSGFLLGPPLVGMVAEAAGLSLALGLTVIAALIIAAMAGSAQTADVRFVQRQSPGR
jgi:MFS family permease